MPDTYLLNINQNLAKNDFDRLLRYVSEDKRERILRFHRFEDAQRSLLGDILARYAICKRLGVRNAELVFGLNEYGKPLLIEPDGIFFNISHSGEWVACAVADSLVGIDVEMIKPVDYKIAEGFFSEIEYLFLMNQPEETRQKYFYILWALKESFIKAEGKGLSIPFDSFTVDLERKEIRLQDEENVINNKTCSYFKAKSDKYVLSVTRITKRDSKEPPECCRSIK